jgi:hypothetical protein
MEMAMVQVGGETALQTPGGNANAGIPIQVITAGGSAPNGASCTLGGGGSDNSASALGANGILGVGNYMQDCGTYCESTPQSFSSPPWPYIYCNSTTCGYAEPVPLTQQAWNPVSTFASADTNGVVLQLPPISASGATSVNGMLLFGIGTQSCTGAPNTCAANGLAGAQVYALDGNGNFPTTVLNGLTYNITNYPSSYSAFLDSGSNALYISDAATLEIQDCYIGGTAAQDDTGFYCPTSTLALTNLTLTDNNGVSTPALGLSIANALNLFVTTNDPSLAAFNDLGGDTGTGPSTDYFDFGLPFFFGRNVFVGIMGTAAPNGTTVPNGYWAF